MRPPTKDVRPRILKVFGMVISRDPTNCPARKLPTARPESRNLVKVSGLKSRVGSIPLRIVECRTQNVLCSSDNAN